MTSTQNIKGSVTVQAGDSLSKIAHDKGISYWQNIYYSAYNADFRDKRPNPNMIFPGDKISIPPISEIEIIEKRPFLKHTQTPIYTQKTITTCWRAAGKMLYGWRNPINTEKKFNRRIGKKYQHKESELLFTEFHHFYTEKLNMTVLFTEGPWVNFNLLHSLLNLKGPIIMVLDNQNTITEHAVVVIGYNLFSGVLYYIDPYLFLDSLTFSPMNVMAPSRVPQTATITQTAGIASKVQIKTISIKNGSFLGIIVLGCPANEISL